MSIICRFLGHEYTQTVVFGDWIGSICDHCKRRMIDQPEGQIDFNDNNRKAAIDWVNKRTNKDDLLKMLKKE